jgi:hypothetical protein
LASRFSASITLSLSAYESNTSPSLYVTHDLEQGAAAPTRLARLLLERSPPPSKTLEGKLLQDRDLTKHELAHIHLSEGSLHVALSPQDARRVIEKKWGELHRLSGLFYRGFYFPPYWLPSRILDVFGGQALFRWGYLQNEQPQKKAGSSSTPSIPPTYCILYAPKNQEQVEWVNAIIDSSVFWAVGQPF